MNSKPDVQFPNPTPEQLAIIRRLLPPKTDNKNTLTDGYFPLLNFLEEELGLIVSAEHDQHVYTSGASILWCARSSLLDQIESALENAVTLRESGEGGGHGLLIHVLGLLGYKATSSHEAERIGSAVIKGQL